MGKRTNITIIIVFSMLVVLFASCSKKMQVEDGTYTINRITPYTHFYLIETSRTGHTGKYKIISPVTSYIGKEKVKEKERYQLDLVYLYDYIYYREELNHNKVDFTCFPGINDWLLPPECDEVHIAGSKLELRAKEDGLKLFYAQNLSGLYIVDNNKSEKGEVKKFWEHWHRPQNIPYLTIDSIFKLRMEDYYDSTLKIIEDVKQLKEIKY